MVTRLSWSGYILPLHSRSGFQEHLHVTWSSIVKTNNNNESFAFALSKSYIKSQQTYFMSKISLLHVKLKTLLLVKTRGHDRRPLVIWRYFPFLSRILSRAQVSNCLPQALSGTTWALLLRGREYIYFLSNYVVLLMEQRKVQRSFWSR